MMMMDIGNVSIGVDFVLNAIQRRLHTVKIVQHGSNARPYPVLSAYSIREVGIGFYARCYCSYGST